MSNTGSQGYSCLAPEPTFSGLLERRASVCVRMCVCVCVCVREREREMNAVYFFLSMLMSHWYEMER